MLIAVGDNPLLIYIYKGFLIVFLCVEIFLRRRTSMAWCGSHALFFLASLFLSFLSKNRFKEGDIPLFFFEKEKFWQESH